MQKRAGNRRISIFLVLVLLLTMTVPSSAGTGTGNMEVIVTESDGQIILQWQDSENTLFSRMKISGAGKTIYVEKGIEQAVYTNLINGIEYSFRLSMISNTGVILDETVVWGTPRDVTPPAPVSNAYGIPGDGCVVLNWIDPSGEDLDRIRITGENRVVEVDRAVGQALIDGLDNGQTYRFIITAVDTSGNESEGVEIISIPEAGARIHLGGPETVQNGQTFSVTMDVYSSRSDVYAVEAILQYDSEYFEFLEYEEPENGIMVVHVDESSEGTVGVYVASDGKPITGQDNRMITLRFKSRSFGDNKTGWFQIGQAFAGIAPSGDKIPVAANSIGVTIVQDILPEVSDVQVFSGDKTISLSWIDPSNKPFDHVLVILDGATSYSVAKGQQGITIPGLVNGVSYQFVLKVVDADGNTSHGVIVSGTPEPGDQTPPSEVTDVKVITGNGCLTLNWRDPEDTDFMNVLITVNDTITYEVNKGVQEKVILGLINGQMVTVKIQTVDERGNVSEGIQITGRPGIPGDVNYDGVVNVGDLAMVAYYYRAKEGQPGWEQARYCDVTGTNGEPDGAVDIMDIVFVAAKVQERP